MKKRTKAAAVISAAVSAALLLSACGSQAKSDISRDKNAGYEYAAVEEAAPAYASEADTYNTVSEGGYAVNEEGIIGMTFSAYGKEDVKLIFSADVSIKTKDLEKTVNAINALTEGFGGYIESSSIYTDYSRNAYLTVRVPSESYESFLTGLSEDGNNTVTSLSRSTTDVGLSYADTEAHIETLKIKQERLQKLLSEATEMSDIIELEGALSDVEYQLNSYSSDLKRYDSLIGYSTVHVNISESASESVTIESSFGDRIAAAFKNSMEGFKEGFEFFVLFIITFWPGLLILAAVIILIVKLVKHKRAKKAAGELPSKGKKLFGKNEEINPSEKHSPNEEVKEETIDKQ